jgi:hypothetical protein
VRPKLVVVPDVVEKDGFEVVATENEHPVEPEGIAVGTALTGGPPRRSQRARLTHWAPA